MKHTQSRNNKGRHTAFLSRYRHLVRLIAIGIVLLFVFTVASSVLIFSRSYTRLQETTDSAMENVASIIHDTLAEYETLFGEIGMTCIATPYTYEPYMLAQPDNNSVNSGILYARELLWGYSLSLPMVSNISIYYNQSQNVLYTIEKSDTMIHWDPFSVYHRVALPELDFSKLINTLSTLETSMFYLDDALLAKGKMLYMVPICIKKGVDSRRVLMFSITTDSFKKAVEGTMAHNYAVESISWNDNCIYHQQTPENSHRFIYTGDDSFTVTLSMPEEVYHSILSNYSSSVLRLGIVSVIVCAGAIAMYIFFSYSPINKIVKQAGVDVKDDELAAVQDYISRKERNENELRAELESEREVSRLKELELLLLGLPSNEGQSILPQSDSAYFYVAVAPLASFPNVNSSVKQLKTSNDIVAFEQYRTGYLVMIIGSNRDDARDDIRKSIISVIGKDVSIGVGSAASSAGQLHGSYLDAIVNINRLCGTVKTVADPFPDILSQDDFNRFHSQISANDIAAKQTAQMMFDRLDVLSNSTLLQWHNSIRLIEGLCNVLTQYGYKVNLAELLDTSSHNDPAKIREVFFGMLDSLLQGGPQEETDTEKELGEKIIQYIKENLSNDVLCISDISNTFNLSDLTASKLIRDQTNMYFKRYLIQSRLEVAKEMLSESNESIQDIAQQCGFASASYFNHVFKNETGLTPSQYRNSSNE